MDEAIRDSKKNTRKRLLEVINSLSVKETHEKSLAACRKLVSTQEYRCASVVMMFLSLPREVNTQWAVEYMLNNGKRVVVPHVVWNDRQMVPVVLSSLDCEMTTDRYGLRCPKQAKTVKIDEIDLMIVPGIGFDMAGRRLGRGGGFYDRFLSNTCFNGMLCGLAFSEQVVSDVPINKNDVNINMLVTDQGINRFCSNVEMNKIQ